MPTVLYRSFSTSTAAQQVTTTAARDGRLLGVRIFGFVEGAAGTTLLDAEVALNIGTTTNYTTNNPDRKSAMATLHAGVISGTASTFDTGFVPCDCPLKAADVLTLSTSTSITTPTRLRIGAEFVVDEKS